MVLSNCIHCTHVQVQPRNDLFSDSRLSGGPQLDLCDNESRIVSKRSSSEATVSLARVTPAVDSPLRHASQTGNVSLLVETAFSVPLVELANHASKADPARHDFEQRKKTIWHGRGCE